MDATRFVLILAERADTDGMVLYAFMVWKPNSAFDFNLQRPRLSEANSFLALVLVYTEHAG